MVRTLLPLTQTYKWLSDSDFKKFKNYIKVSGFNFKTKTEQALQDAITIAKEEELDGVINTEYKNLTTALQTYKSNAISGNKTQLKSLKHIKSHESH